MKFFNKELCQKLEALGLKSKSGQMYVQDYKHVIIVPSNASLYMTPYRVYALAFSAYDFLSDEEYAKENARILFADPKRNKYENRIIVKTCCHALLDADDQEKFIEEALNAK